MLHSNGVRAAGTGPEGGKHQVMNNLPADAFRPRHPKQSPQNGSPTVPDYPWKQAREVLDPIDSRRGSPFGSSQTENPPTSLHHAFVRDIGDHWSRGKESQRTEWLPITDRHSRYDRGDPWNPPPRRSSPIRGPSPPRRRPSPPRHSSYGYGERLRSPLAHAPNAHARHTRHTSDTFQPHQRFSNLSWKASNHFKAQPNDIDRPPIQDHEVPRSVAPAHTFQNGAQRYFDNSKVAYNGLRDVPIGPKKRLGALPPVSAAIKTRPHLFVSAQHLPTLTSTHEHLYGAVRHWVASQSDVHLDDAGWYLCFENTAAGRSRLEDCYDMKNKFLLFKEYTIHMERFPYGIWTPAFNGDSAIQSPLQSDITEESGAANGNSSTAVATKEDTTGTPASKVTVVQAQGSIDKHSDVNNLNSLSSPIALINRNVLKVESTMSNSTAPSERVHIFGRQSSPLRVPSRLDRDDSLSCVSVPTGSDSSRSKRLKCHVCKTGDPFDSDNLINCSSCPRRYHRRCHVQPAVPARLELPHTWQCRRCVKKHVHLRTSMRSLSPAPGSPIYTGSPSAEQPQKRLRLDSAEPRETIVPVAPPESLSNATGEQSEDRGKEPTGNATEANHAMKDSLITISDETHFLEADDLVAKSFAAPPPTAITPAISTTSRTKSNLVRRKISRPERLHDENASLHSDAQPRAIDDSLDEVIGSGEIYEGTVDQKRKSPGSNGDVGPLSSFPMGAESGLEERRPVTQDKPIAASVFESVTSTEIPESPEELRRPAVSLTVQNHQHEHHIPLPDARDSSLVFHKGFPEEKQEPRIKPQRKKPGSQVADRCRNCSKKIAYNPSGTNKLCMKCKAPAAAVATLEAATSASREQGEASLEDLVPIKGQNKVSETPVNADKESNLSRSFDTEPNSLLDTSDMAQSEPRKINRPKSCGDCRQWRRHCTHNEATPEVPAPSAPPSEDHQAKTRQADDEAYNVLDFWTSGETISDKDDDGPVVNTGESHDLDLEDQSPTTSELSDAAEEEADEAPRKAITKRRSQTRPALNQHDLGDSIERPKGTYEKLIGMALCSAPNHRMRGTDVTKWVAKNISGYKAGEGKWENSLRATLTLKKQGYEGRDGLWKKIETEGAKKNETCWWELLPGQAEKMLHWDPVLGQPVSPPKAWSKTKKDPIEHQGGAVSDDGLPGTSASAQLQARRKKQEKRKRLRQGQSGRKEKVMPSAYDGGELRAPGERTADVSGSSDEEPLVKSKRPRLRSPEAAEDVLMIDAPQTLATDVPPSHEVDTAKKATRPKPASLIDQPLSKTKTAAQLPVQPVSVADMIAMEAGYTQYSAKSLYTEWPEYDPKGEIDREAKMVEIKNRPTRKQRLAAARKQKSSKQNLLAEMGTPHPVVEYTVVNDSPSKSSRINLYPWEATEDNILQCATLEELFNLPKNPVAIIHDGQLAYRDGTRNEDGTLPRAKVIYKTGHGKGDTSR